MLVQVNLYNKSIANVEWNSERGMATFQYTDSFLESNIEPSPILMPKEGKTFITNRDHINFHSLPYLLADSMPDDFGNMMMKEWLRQKSLTYNDINPVDRLTYVGIRGMGALEYQPLNHSIETGYNVNVTELLEVASNVLSGKIDTNYRHLNRESLTNILRIGTSVGGARAKALLAIKEDDNSNIIDIKSGDILQSQDYTYWLLKMDGANEISLGESHGMGKIEFAYYLMAKKCKVEMSECRLYEEGERFHFMTKRFDRSADGHKIHMQTLGSLVGIDYKIQRASSYETLFRTMKRLRLPYSQIEQQYRRAIFNVIARNQDDHVKNFSFLMDKNGVWKISPAYDITYSYKPGGRWTDVHQSAINGKFAEFTRNDLLELGNNFGIKKSNQIIDEVIDAVSEWSRIAIELDIPRSKIDLVENNLRLKI